MTRHAEFRPRASWPVLLWRFVAGEHLDGVHRTDASFLHGGTQSLLKWKPRPSRWSMYPGWVRSAWRLGTIAAAALTAWEWFYRGRHLLVLGVWSALLLGLLGWAGWRTVRWVRIAQHVRRYVRPLHLALSGPLGVPLNADPTGYLSVPRTFATNPDTPVRVGLPPEFATQKDLQSLLSTTVPAKLGMEDPAVTFHLAGAGPYMLVRTAPRPPAAVTLQDLLPLIAAASDSAPVLGLGVKRSPVSVDLDAESPHIAISAAPGAGKSVLARVLIMQLLARGHLVVILDVKRVSHAWARGLPGVAYCRSAEEIHHALITIAAEGERRYTIIDEQGEEVAQTFPRVFVVSEETNAMMNRLNAYWRLTRENSDPKISPAVEAFGEGVFMGRQARIHFLTIAQLLSVKSMGGDPGIREAFSTRIMARATVNAWKMLAPEIWPIPRGHRRPGRVHVVLAGEARECQVANVSADDARAFALAGQQSLGLELPAGRTVSQLLSQQPVHLGAGRPTVTGVTGAPDRPALPADRADGVPEWFLPAPQGAPGDLAPVPLEPGATRPALWLVPSQGGPDDPVPAPELPAGEQGQESAGELVGLGQACATGGVLADSDPPVSLASARAARQRDPEFPAPAGRRGQELLYEPDDLARWAGNRVRTGTD